MISALITGELADDVTRRETKAGNAMWTASMRVSVGEGVVFVSLAVFDEEAGARLERLHKGSPLSAVGTLAQTRWVDKRTQQERTGWRLTATEILSVLQARRATRPAEPPDDPPDGPNPAAARARRPADDERRSPEWDEARALARRPQR